MKDGRPKRGMDRDLALKVLALCSAVKDALDDLLDTMFIIYQPKSVTAAIGDSVSFTVIAMNVNAYQWQYSTNGTQWYTTSAEGNKTATMSVEATEERYNNYYRCRLRDADNNTIYSDIVRIYPNNEEV